MIRSPFFQLQSATKNPEQNWIHGHDLVHWLKNRIFLDLRQRLGMVVPTAEDPNMPDSRVETLPNWHVSWAQIIDSYDHGWNKVTVVSWPKEKELILTHDELMKSDGFRAKLESLLPVRDRMMNAVHVHVPENPFVYVFFIRDTDLVAFTKSSSELFPLNTEKQSEKTGDKLRKESSS